MEPGWKIMIMVPAFSTLNLGDFLLRTLQFTNTCRSPPYVYGANNPTRFVDELGMGLGTELKRLIEFIGADYKQQSELLKRVTRTYLRNGKLGGSFGLY